MNFNYHYAYPVGTGINEPQLLPAFIEDRNGHILPFVRFTGGQFRLDAAALQVLETTARKRGQKG